MDSAVTNEIQRVLDVNDRQSNIKFLENNSDLGLESIALTGHEGNRGRLIKLLAELCEVTLIETGKVSVADEEMLEGVRLLKAQLEQSDLLLFLLGQLT